MSSFPKRGHWGSDGLGPECDRTLYISVSDLIFKLFSLYVIYLLLSCAVITYQRVFLFNFLDFENFFMDMKISQYFGEIWVSLVKKVDLVQIY